MIYIPKHKPPSRARYEKSHPTVTFRLNRKLKEQLEKKLKNQSFSDFIKDCLETEKRKEKLLEDERTRIHDEGVLAGYDRGIEDFSIRVPCSICGKPMMIRSQEERRYVARVIFNQGWSHPECHLDEMEKRSRE